MYEKAEKISFEQTAETLDDLAELLDITDNNTNIWVCNTFAGKRPYKPVTTNNHLWTFGQSTIDNRRLNRF